MTTATQRRRQTSKTNGSVTKAEEIRKAARELGGRKVRPRDVIALLATKGITVVRAQVSSTLKAAGYRRLRRRKATVAPKAHHASATSALSLEHLLAAKALVSKLGSVEVAKKALDMLAKLA